MTLIPTISAAIIALDEAENLASLLPQLRWADEVVVVDGGSRDATVDTAHAAGATVVQRRFDRFAAQRNAALDAATCDWVLFVDADERPTPRLVQELRQKIRDRMVNGYRVPIRSRIFDRPFRFCGTQNDSPLRLMRRGFAEWHGAVHETCRLRGAIGRLDAHLEHRTMPTVAACVRKIRRYTTLEAEARVERGELPRRFDAWLRPAAELYRRLFWKQGWLDGSAGWKFAALSAYSEWTLAAEHRRLWQLAAASVTRRTHAATTRLHGFSIAGGAR